MQAGRLDRRVAIEQVTTTRNSRGEVVPAWATLAAVWAEKQELSGSERYLSEQFDATVSVRWKVRYRADVTPAMRLVHRGEEYEIDSVQEIGRREGLFLYTTVRRPERV